MVRAEAQPPYCILHHNTLISNFDLSFEDCSPAVSTQGCRSYLPQDGLVAAVWLSSNLPWRLSPAARSSAQGRLGMLAGWRHSAYAAAPAIQININRICHHQPVMMTGRLYSVMLPVHYLT